METKKGFFNFKGNKINLFSIFLLIIILILATKYFYDFKKFSQKELIYLNELTTLNQAIFDNLKIIEKIKKENINLNQILEEERNKNKAFEGQIQFIKEQVGGISKLVSLDKKLLEKYSKVYFLNENYAPQKLSLINSKYVYNKSKQEYIHSNVLPFLEKLLNDAINNGINLRIISAYRSFAEQSGLKSTYRIIYGSGANQFSADQGYSEHQLGTTVDFTTEELGNNFEKFDKTNAYTWLKNNAHKYGFILSYPQNNKYYIFEPWHWRFVGIKLATHLYNNNQNFYDLDQKEIDQYLIYIFDE